MTYEFLTSRGVLFLSLIFGFFAYTAYGYLRKTGPLNEETITSNGGSRMMYVVWQAVIPLVYVGLVALSVLGSVKLFEGNPPASYFLSQPVLSAIAGAVYSRAAILRAKDAGFSRGGALLGIVPFANIWLMVAPPKEAPERPPYVPAAVPARVLIILCAIAVFFLSGPVNTIIAEKLAGIRIATRIEQGDFDFAAPLPTQLAETSTFQKIEPDAGEKAIYYQYGISGPDLDRDRIRSWLKDTLKSELAKYWCQERLIADRGWTVWYEYWDPDDRLVASTRVSQGDCRRLKSG
ncbi:hypothetical protein [Roseibium aggregatum]|uniref:Uncharacterized protein n=1 Tax=Roseibium aggregatum TaxID=187304 RepID=A0A926P2B6_9HYPH|nr:hypothetical protein [Roseibium aggregatum]MBD1548746.1 hypothetical protein [Roseibium aggregatum]